ncbi:hypothetical protein WA026_008467 [Henosepilachna vigintioctopunctata]|uniref:Uncharacterized protein n=1 Tax=Henosepilachna vigintioctopunctata TaxID=420089 RepID=A0AAW1U898_9CUCU
MIASTATDDPYSRVATSKPTRVFTNIRGKTLISQIDYIIASTNTQIHSKDVVETHFSDHRLVWLKCFIGNPETIELKTVNSMVEFCDIFKFDDVNYCFQHFVNVISDIIEKCCPSLKHEIVIMWNGLPPK